MAPFQAPLVMEFQGSSFPLTWTILRSVMENRPPQTAKLPPNCGALVLRSVKLPPSLWFPPTGELRKPSRAWKIPPPTVRMAKAPPQSSTRRQGRGSHAYSSLLTPPRRDARTERPGHLSKDGHRADQQRTSLVSRPLDTKFKVCATYINIIAWISPVPVAKTRNSKTGMDHSENSSIISKQFFFLMEIHNYCEEFGMNKMGKDKNQL